MAKSRRLRDSSDEAALVRVLARRYWREAEARVVVDALERSGLSLADFASRHGVASERVRRWAERLDVGARVAPPLAFLPVRVRDEAPSIAAPAVAPVEVVIGRYVVRLAGRFEPAVLEQVVDMLERRGG